MSCPLRPKEGQLCDDRRLQYGARSNTLAKRRRNIQTNRIR